MARIEQCENQMQLINNVYKITSFHEYLKTKKDMNDINMSMHKKQKVKSRAIDWYEGYAACLKDITEGYEHNFWEELL